MAEVMPVSMTRSLTPTLRGLCLGIIRSPGGLFFLTFGLSFEFGVLRCEFSAKRPNNLQHFRLPLEGLATGVKWMREQQKAASSTK
jgi:hypothetical protein